MGHFRNFPKFVHTKPEAISTSQAYVQKKKKKSNQQQHTTCKLHFTVTFFPVAFFATVTLDTGIQWFRFKESDMKITLRMQS